MAENADSWFLWPMAWRDTDSVKAEDEPRPRLTYSNLKLETLQFRNMPLQDNVRSAVAYRTATVKLNFF